MLSFVLQRTVSTEKAKFNHLKKNKEHEIPRTTKQSNNETGSGKINQFKYKEKKNQSSNRTLEKQKSKSKEHIPWGDRKNMDRSMDTDRYNEQTWTAGKTQTKYTDANDKRRNR